MKVLGLLICFLMFGSAFAANFEDVEVTATATTTSTMVLDIDGNRCGFVLQNKGSQKVLVKPSTIQTGNEGLIIVPGGNWSPVPAPKNRIFIKTEAGSSPVSIIVARC